MSNEYTYVSSGHIFLSDIAILPGLGDRAVPGDGPLDARVVAVGEAPGRHEHNFGQPFCGDAGLELDLYSLQFGHVDRGEWYITNVCKQRPPDNRDPRPDEIEYWRPVLVRELTHIQPDIILTLGAFATKWFLSESADLETLHGIPQTIDGTAFGLPRPLTIFPCFHPAGGIHDSNVIPQICADMAAFGRYLKSPYSHITDPYAGRENYQVLGNSSAQFIYDTVVRADWLGLDTEENGWCMTWSTSPGTGYFIFGTDKKALKALRDAMRDNPRSRANIRWIGIHNCLYDISILSHMGSTVPLLNLSDTMIGAFNRCLDPKGLKPLAYRHFGMRMEDYQGIVRPYNLAHELSYWSRVRTEFPSTATVPILEIKAGKPHLKKATSAARRAEGVFRDIAKNKRLKSGEPIDPRKRWDDTPDIIRDPIIAKLGDMPTATLRDAYDKEPARVIHYATRDADAGCRLVEEQYAQLNTESLYTVHNIDMSVVPMVERMQETGLYADVSHFKSLSDEFGSRMSVLSFQMREISGLPDLNPNSRDQIAHLFFDMLHFKPGHKTAGGQRYEVNDAVLEINKGRSPIIPVYAEYTELAKLKNTYCDKLPLYVGADGRLRFRISLTTVPSGRMATKSPNIMAIPSRSKMGLRVREGFIPTPESICGVRRVYYEIDESQIEMRVLADEAGEGLLRNIFRRREDMHVYTACRIFGLKPADVSKQLRGISKNIGFGTVYLITPKGQLDQMASFGITHLPSGEKITIDHTTRWIAEFWKLFPECKLYMDGLTQFARDHGYTVDMFGRKRYGQGVYSRIERVQMEAVRALCNHPTQSSAQGIMKRAMAGMWDGLPVFWNAGHYVEPIVQVHDSLLFECDADSVTVLDAFAQYVMANSTIISVPLMGESKTADNWAKCK